MEGSEGADEAVYPGRADVETTTHLEPRSVDEWEKEISTINRQVQKDWKERDQYNK